MVVTDSIAVTKPTNRTFYLCDSLASQKRCVSVEFDTFNESAFIACNGLKFNTYNVQTEIR